MSEVMVIPFWERYTMTIEKAAKYFFLFRLLAVLNPLLTRLGCPPNFFISIYGRPPSMKSTLAKLLFCSYQSARRTANYTNAPEYRLLLLCDQTIQSLKFTICKQKIINPFST